MNNSFWKLILLIRRGGHPYLGHYMVQGDSSELELQADSWQTNGIVSTPVVDG